MRTLRGYQENNRIMAKRDIYLSDELDQRARVAGVKVSPLCQPVIGYAVLHG
jgi:post-segregation antitoxin (ccd killing protein)